MKKIVLFITCLGCAHAICDETTESFSSESNEITESFLSESNQTMESISSEINEIIESFLSESDQATESFSIESNEITESFLSETQNKSPLQNSASQTKHEKDKARGLNIEVKAGYFIFSDHTMRKVYNNGGEDIQFCFSYPVWNIWNLYGSIEYLERHGRSLNDHQRTRIQELPLTLGLKPIFPISSAIDYYFTLGPRYTFVWVKNHSSYVDKHMHKSGFGGFVGTGLIFHLAQHWNLDLFGEYSFTQLHFHSSKHNSIGESRQVGGFTFGLGLGYQL